MMSFLPLVVLLVLFGQAVNGQASSHVSETNGNSLMPLQAILPKLQAIHEDTKSLLIKNGELKTKILDGLQAQNEAKLKLVKEGKLTTNPIPAQSQASAPSQATNQQLLQPHQLTAQANQKQPVDKDNDIDYSELEEFNKWVDVNLEYAVKNTQLSIEALKEEAAQNNGQINYTEQAIKDGIEGVKYWQSAVIFQDKTLKNEKYEDEN